MLLIINFHKDEVIFQGETVLVLKPRFYSQYALAGYLYTTKENHFPLKDGDKVLKSKDLLIGQRGGISLEK